MDILRRAARILIATGLGIVLGAEVFLAGIGALIHPGLIALYLLLFLITDELQAKWSLSQRHIFVLGMIVEIWFGALISQELYQPGLPFPLGWGGINLISLVLVTMAWGMFLVTWMHLVERLCPRPPHLRFLWLRHLTIVGLIVFLALFYLGNKFDPTRIFEDLSLVTLGTVGAVAWVRWVRRRHVAHASREWSRGILTLAGIFIVLSFVSVVIPLGTQFHIFWTFLIWLPLFLIFARRRPLRL